MTEWLEGLGRLSLLVKESHRFAVYFQGGMARSALPNLFHRRKIPIGGPYHGSLTGMVLAPQTYLQFHKVKMDTATLAVVSVSMCKPTGAGLDRPDGRGPRRRRHRCRDRHHARHRTN